MSRAHTFKEHPVLVPEPVEFRPEAVELQPQRRALVLRRLLVVCDVVGVAVAWALALSLPGRNPSPFAGRPLALAVAVLIMTCGGLAAIASQRLYLARVCGVRAVELERLARAAAVSGLFAYGAAHAFNLTVTGLRATLGAGVMFVLLALLRSGYEAWLKSSRAQGKYSRPIVVVGGNEEGFELYRLLHTHPELGFRINGIVGSAEECRKWGTDVPWLGEVGDVARVVRSTGANGVVVAASAVPPEQLNRMTRELLAAGVHVHLSSGLKGIAQRRLRSLPLAYEPLFYLEPIALTSWQLRVKRVIDVVLASTAMVLASPVLLASAIAIKLQDRGPVFFKQERVGKNGKTFECIKLRTMVPNAERLLIDITTANERSGGPLFKLASDPRRTRVGRFLEATSLDELPQLINVLKGEMSLVGPRPALPREVAEFDDELQARHTVPPGITGLWQVEARDNPSFLAYRRLDLFYVENWSVALDVAILVSTGKAILVRLLRRGR
jgi:exopolysaccharide biosynthesis polyprenyl glycosylphosphotransferase